MFYGARQKNLKWCRHWNVFCCYVKRSVNHKIGKHTYKQKLGLRILKSIPFTLRKKSTLLNMRSNLRAVIALEEVIRLIYNNSFVGKDLVHGLMHVLTNFVFLYYAYSRAVCRSLCGGTQSIWQFSSVWCFLYCQTVLHISPIRNTFRGEYLCNSLSNGTYIIFVFLYSSIWIFKLWLNTTWKLYGAIMWTCA